jgi:hypothetical protein
MLINQIVFILLATAHCIGIVELFRISCIRCLALCRDKLLITLIVFVDIIYNIIHKETTSVSDNLCPTMDTRDTQ